MMRWLLTILVLVAAVLVPSWANAQCATEARYLRMQMRYQEAELLARECTEVDGGNPDAWVELARALAGQGEHDEALEWVDRALEEYSESDDLRLLKARILAWLERTDESLELLRRLPDDIYERPEALRLRGDVHLWRGDFEQAARWFDRYAEVDPDHPIVLYKRALAYRGIGEHGQALEAMEKSCEIAPQATEACEALEDFAHASYPVYYVNTLYAYNRVIERIDGWSLRGSVGSIYSENLKVEGTWEWIHRSFFDRRIDDWRFRGDAAYQFDSGLRAKAGAGMSLDPTFSPRWHAYAEPGFQTDLFSAGLRFWHVEFPRAPVEVLNPNVELYFKPWMLELRYFLAFEDGGEQIYNSGFGRLFYFFTNLTQFYVGGGLGDRSDFLEPRDLDAQSHWLVTLGFRYMVTSNHRLLINATQRHDRADDESYDQTETMIGYEFRW